ncbi:MAG: hypothetical protein KJ949_02265, partial [Nanoarchaeota archaeon]|nr:hypothetical protein [Nanoarchaeota archaeon]
MKKEGKIIFCLSLVLILSLSLVSAGWFSNLFGGTGKVISSGTCGGESILCSNFKDITSCKFHKGCSWGVMTANAIAIEEGLAAGCSGTPTECSLFEEELFCKNQKGCSWTEGIDKEVKPVSACVFGEEKCVGENYYVCDKVGNWVDKGNVDGKCGYSLKKSIGVEKKVQATNTQQEENIYTKQEGYLGNSPEKNMTIPKEKGGFSKVGGFFKGIFGNSEAETKDLPSEKEGSSCYLTSFVPCSEFQQKDAPGVLNRGCKSSAPDYCAKNEDSECVFTFKDCSEFQSTWGIFSRRNHGCEFSAPSYCGKNNENECVFLLDCGEIGNGQECLATGICNWGEEGYYCQRDCSEFQKKTVLGDLNGCEFSAPTFCYPNYLTGKCRSLWLCEQTTNEAQCKEIEGCNWEEYDFSFLVGLAKGTVADAYGTSDEERYVVVPNTNVNILSESSEGMIIDFGFDPENAYYFDDKSKIPGGWLIVDTESSDFRGFWTDVDTNLMGFTGEVGDEVWSFGGLSLNSYT